MIVERHHGKQPAPPRGVPAGASIGAGFLRQKVLPVRLNFASAHALARPSKQGEFYVEPERESGPQREGAAEIGHESGRAGKPAARREDPDEAR